MKRQIAVLALLSCVACYSADPSVGTCNVAADCKLPDGGPFPGATCTDNRCSYAGRKVCGGAEACVHGQCISQGPAIGTVTVVSPAPPNWARASDMLTVTAVVDDTQGPSGAVAGQPAGIASATLQIQGQPDIAGATIDTGLVRTYTFTVNAGTVQASDSETPVHFTIAKSYLGAGNQGRIQFGVVAADKTGNALPGNTAALGIDGTPPSITLIGGAVQYPAQGSGCNANANVFCGHDAAGHFWRKG